MSKIAKIIHSPLSPLANHSIPGKYFSFFEENKSGTVEAVKTLPKKKKRRIQNLDSLIPRIRSALDFATLDHNLSTLYTGIIFPKITADSQKLVLYYALEENGNRNVLKVTQGLLYKYLTRKVSAKSFPSRLEFREYSFRDEKLEEIYRKIEAELRC